MAVEAATTIKGVCMCVCIYVCNSYTTGTSALPAALMLVRIYRQSTSACGITNMFYFSMQTHLIGKIFSCYTLLLYREPSKL